MKIFVEDSEWPILQETGSTDERNKQVMIREVNPDDVHALESLYHSLSPGSLYDRYMRHCEAPLDECSEICKLGNSVDGAAIVMTADSHNHIIGVAHYIAVDTIRAEPAIIVADKYQSQGIGTALFRHLCDKANKNGIQQFDAYANSSNRSVLRVVQKSGYTYKSMFEYGQRHIQIELNKINDENL